MSLSPKMTAAIVALRERLDDLSHPWMITGSVAAALHGVATSPGDIDIETDERGAYAIERRLSDLVELPVTRRTDEGETSSAFGRFLIAGVAVEVMGDMRMRSAGGEWRGPHDVAPRLVVVEFEGGPLPIATRDALVRLYDDLERPDQSAEVRALRIDS
jgi:hypothetical protein